MQSAMHVLDERIERRVEGLPRLVQLLLELLVLLEACCVDLVAAGAEVGLGELAGNSLDK